MSLNLFVGARRLRAFRKMRLASRQSCASVGIRRLDSLATEALNVRRLPPKPSSSSLLRLLPHLPKQSSRSSDLGLLSDITFNHREYTLSPDLLRCALVLAASCLTCSTFAWAPTGNQHLRLSSQTVPDLKVSSTRYIFWRSSGLLLLG